MEDPLREEPDSREALLEENTRLREALSKKVVDGTMLRELQIKNGGIYVGLEGGACGLFADAFAHQFKELGATNYVEVGFTHPDVGDLTVTMQRRQGRTPHQLRAAAEVQRDRLRTTMDWILQTLQRRPETAASKQICEAISNAICDAEATQKALGT